MSDVRPPASGERGERTVWCVAVAAIAAVAAYHFVATELRPDIVDVEATFPPGTVPAESLAWDHPEIRPDRHLAAAWDGTSLRARIPVSPRRVVAFYDGDGAVIAPAAWSINATPVPTINRWIGPYQAVPLIYGPRLWQRCGLAALIGAVGGLACWVAFPPLARWGRRMTQHLFAAPGAQQPTPSWRWLAGGGALFFAGVASHGWAGGGSFAWLQTLPLALLLLVGGSWMRGELGPRVAPIAFLLTGAMAVRWRLHLGDLGAGIDAALWCAVFLVIGWWAAVRLHQTNSRWLLPAALGLIGVNALGHLSADSPYSCAPDVAAGIFYAVPLSGMLVNGDLIHFAAVEHLFAVPGYDPLFSVCLRRFLAGYVTSFASGAQMAWWSQFTLNLVAWLVAVLATERIARHLSGQPAVAQATALATASGFGFVAMVGQFSTYHLSYALAACALWLTLEATAQPNKRIPLWFVALPIASICVYDIAPVLVACAAIAAYRRRWALAGALSIGPFVCLALWTQGVLMPVYGSTGNPKNAEVLTRSVAAWLEAVRTLNLSVAGEFVSRGLKACWFGGLWFGLPAAVVAMAWPRVRQAMTRGASFVALAGALHLLNWAGASAVAPETVNWSRGGVMPRVQHYTYPIDNFAAVCALYALRPCAVWAVPATTWLLANADKFGLHGVRGAFHYGTTDLAPHLLR